MKKPLAIVSLLFLIIIMSSRVTNAQASTASAKSYKEIPGVTKEEISAIEKLKSEKGSFTYGHLLEIESFLLPDGTHIGLTSEFCMLLSELFGIEFVQVPYSVWQQLRIDVNNQVIDFTSDLTPTSEHNEVYYMTSHIADRPQHIITLANTNIKTEEDVNGLKLGFLENSTNIEPILRRYPSLSFETVAVDYIASVERMLVSGEIDAFVTERTLEAFFGDSDSIVIRDFFPFAYTSISLITANESMEPVISVINKYLAAGGIDDFNKLYKESEYEYTKLRLMKSLTDDEQAYLNNLSKYSSDVKIALENDNYPYSFYNETEKEFQGMAVDILNEISKLTGIRFTNTAAPTAKWSDILNELKANSVSLVSQLGYSDARKSSFIWSEPPYSVSDFALISKADFPKVESYQISRLRVGVTDNTVYKDVYKEWFIDCDNLVLYTSQNDALDALEKGEVDLVMGAENILLTQVNYREKTGYIINYRFTASMDATFGFNKDDEILCSIISKAQQQIDVSYIESYWKSRVFDYSKLISKIQTRYLSVIALSVVIVLVVVVILLIKNDRLRKTLVDHAITLSAMYNSIPDLVFSKDTNGVYTSCNLSFEKYAGSTEAEVLGKTDAEVFKRYDTEVTEHIMEWDKRVIERGSLEIVEETITYPDNTQRLMETLKAPMIKDDKVVGLLGISRDVTERNEASSRFERIINTAQIAFMLTVDGYIAETNDYSRKHIGVEIGDSILPFYTDPLQRNEIMKIAEDHGTASNIIVYLNTIDGESHRFLTSVTSTEYDQRKAYLMWALDIEQNEKKGEQLYAVQQSFQSVLDALPMPVRIVDAETGEIIYVNDSLLELLEYESSEEVCGLNILDILPDTLSDGSDAAERSDLVRQGIDSISVEIEYRTRTGKIIEAMVVSRRIAYNGRYSSIGIIKDLTAEKERERVLLDAAEREKEANQTKSRFLANMSHEIRTPMNGVIGMTDLLLGEELSGRQLQYVKDIKTSAESLLSIINDILDLSKITEGRLQIAAVDIDLSVLLKNTVSMMSFTAHSKGLDFIDDVQVNTPEYVRVDDVRLKQIIVNLLSNAIKFTKEGHVELSARIEGGSIVFAVSDTGIGIKNDEMSLIFMPFEQADKRKNRAIKGTGLGLSISKNLVELMGGEIWFESEYGVGTTFFVKIPYMQANKEAVEAVEAINLVFEYISAPTAQVLLVDDIQTNLTVGAGLLRHCKITADVAVSGFEAIEMVRAKDYDIVFMDHMMPEMDGIEATGLIRSMGDKYKDLPIIALTANAVNESKELLLSSGMNDFLSKPIDKSELMQVLMKWLPRNKIALSEKANDSYNNEPYSQILEKASKIDGLDIKLALSRISGMQDVLEESIQQIANSIPERIKIMDAALAESDLHNFGIYAHGLKGAFANIGAMGYSELAAGLEIAAKADNMSQCLEKFSVFADVIEGLANELKLLFPRIETEAKPLGGNELLMQKTTEAVDCLNSFESEDALKCLNELGAYTFGKETDDVLDEARSLIKAFKHKKAALILKTLSEKQS